MLIRHLLISTLKMDKFTVEEKPFEDITGISSPVLKRKIQRHVMFALKEEKASHYPFTTPVL